jgi:hypothetical protein
MKNFSAPQFLVMLLLLGLGALAGQAQTIRRVNNNGITGTNIYATLQLAHNAASAGDIIQVEPSTTAYSSLTISKPLTIVGAGYFLGENAPPALQATAFPATIADVTFAAGSTGTVVSGLESNSTFYVQANNITIQRCKIAGYIYLGYGLVTDGAVIRQNYCPGVQQSSASTNSLITNNIFINGSVSLPGANTGEFNNNTVIASPVSLNYFNVRNNYFNSTFTPTANTNWAYNLFTNGTLSTLGTQSNNTTSVPLTAVFVLAPTAPGQFDAWYKLKTGTNPATSGGQGGVDIGATGSATNYGYRFAGLPAIPAIYQLNQSVSGNSLNVTLGTRSNN